MLIMENTVGHTIELIFTLQKIGDSTVGATIYQPRVLNIRGPRLALQFFYWIGNSVHLKDFQPWGQRQVYYDKCN